MIQNKRIIIVAHYLLYGAPHALRDYLLVKNINRIFCIFLPLASQRQIFSSEYKKNKSGKLKIMSDRTQTRAFNLGPIDYFLDFIQTIRFVLSKEKYDVFIGFDCLNCLAGLVLKKIGRIKQVIFYSIDFVPIRFQNPLLNIIYHKIEIYCVKHADQTWNVSPRIAEGRKKFLNISDKKYKQSVVPIGVWNNTIKKRSFSQVKKHQLLFLGHLLEKQGVQVVIEALPEVVKKIPDLHFIIAGGGEYKPVLESLVKELSLERYVTFTGWITERKKIDAMMSESALAIATYKPEKKQLYNFTYYADPTKLKDYLSAGLPVILTDISYNAQQIAEKKCGILVQYDKKNIAKAILSLLKNDDRLITYRKNALQFAKEFEWSKIFNTTLKSL